MIKIARRRKDSNGNEIIQFLGILFAIALLIHYLWVFLLLIIIIISIKIVSKYENKPINTQNTYKRNNSKYKKNRSYRKYQNRHYNISQSACNKGDEFENFVAKQFNDNSDYTVVSWTGDKMRTYNVYVESDSGPDLKIRHEPTQEEFYIECKYRSNLQKGKYKWTNDEQRKRYLDFDSKNKEPFYIALGLGGSPSKPDKVFYVPLREARYVGLYPFVFEKYYHDPKVDLVWKNGILR